MSRKQSTVERIRKKQAAQLVHPAPRRREEKNATDPYHNGQTPACRLLLEAVQDIFPELQAASPTNERPSELGTLLRNYILLSRHAAQHQQDAPSPPAPPFSNSSSSPSPSCNAMKTTTATTNTANTQKQQKKRKKKKKSKKDESNDSLDQVHILPDNDNNDNSSNIMEEDVTIPLKEIDGPRGHGDEGNTHSYSLEDLDRSVHSLEQERALHQESGTPALQALPLDGKDGDEEELVFRNNRNDGHSSLTFFEQIQPEMTDREEDEEEDYEYDIGNEVPSYAETSPSTLEKFQKTSPREVDNGRRFNLRARTLSSSSFESFEGGVMITTTPTNTKNSGTNPNNGEHSENPILASPTHEWVPEETAQAKPERPPGEVIKNPLELDFLLSMHNHNGKQGSLTTTTIDGMLISAETSSHWRGSTGLDTTKMLLEEWIGQQILFDANNSREGKGKRQKETKSFIDFVQKKLWKSDEETGIPLSQLEQTIHQIVCRECRQDVHKIFQQWSNRNEKQPLVLNPAVLQEDHASEKDDSDVDAAFDYVALEEGHHLPKHGTVAEEDGVGVDRNTHISLHIAEPKSKRNGTAKCIFVHSFSEKHIQSLIEHWIPCGVEEEILVATSVEDHNDPTDDAPQKSQRSQVLGHKQLTELQSSTLKSLQDSKVALTKMDNTLNEMKEKAEELLALDSSTAQNMNIVAFPKMKEVDDLCSEVADDILHAMVGMCFGGCGDVEDIKFHVWVLYLKALNESLQATDSYYTEIGENLADQRGVLPHAFVSSELRRRFRGLVMEKVRLWGDLGKTLLNLLNGRTLKEMHASMKWYAHNAPTNKRISALDPLCIKVAEELTKWASTLTKSKMSEIYRERLADTERMLELLQNTIEPLAEAYALVEKYFPSDRNTYFASLRSNIGLSQGIKTRMRLVDNAEVEAMATGVLLMWVHVRVMQVREVNSMSIPPMPLQLKRWMLQNENSVIDDWKGFDVSSPLNSFHQRYCQSGRKGKRRALCTLAGLVYQWLREQGKGWKAEQAERELLTGFELEESPAPISSSKPASKSKKNKKKKKATNSINGEEKRSDEFDAGTGTNVSAVGASRINAKTGTVGDNLQTEDQESGPNSLSGNGNKDTNVNGEDRLGCTEKVEQEEEEAWVPNKTNIIAREDPNGPALSTNTETESKSTTDGTVTSLGQNRISVNEGNVDELSDNAEVSADTENLESKIWIVDGTSQFAPERYLVARLRKILRSAEKGDGVAMIS